MGIGDAWGTADELAHPRGPDGRWIKKGGMGKAALARILGFLGGFKPREFQSDAQAGQYAFNNGHKGRPFSAGELARLDADFGPANEDLVDGIPDQPSTKKFVSMMDSHMIELDDDIIVSQAGPPEMFGFTAQTMHGTPDGKDPGIRGLAGKKVVDRGYSATAMGTPVSSGTGQVTVTVAVPKKTKLAFPASSRSDRRVYLSQDQPLRVTTVKPDGRGGYNIMAVAEAKSDAPGEAGQPRRGPVGVGRTGDREEAVKGLEQAQAKRMAAGGEVEQPSDAPLPPGDGGVPRQTDDNIPAPQQPLADGTPPRVEPVVSEGIGGNAPAAEGEAPRAPTPAPPVVDADVAKVRGRSQARERMGHIATALPAGRAVAEMDELDAKKADDKVKAQRLRAIANGPEMDEVPRAKRDKMKADLESAAQDFEDGKPNAGNRKVARLRSESGIQTQHKAGEVADFDESTMDPVGDIPEDGKVEVIRPEVSTVTPSGEKVVLERAQVTGAIAPSKLKKPAQRGLPKKSQDELDDRILERARTMAGPPQNDADRKLLADAAEISERRNADQVARRATGDVSVAEAGAKNLAQPGGAFGPPAKAARPTKKTAAPRLRGTTPEEREAEIQAMNEKSGKKAAAGATETARVEAKKLGSGAGMRVLADSEEGRRLRAEAEGVPDVTDKTTVAELRKIAAERGVDLKGARLKKDIRDRVEGKAAHPQRGDRKAAPAKKTAEQLMDEANKLVGDRKNAKQVESLRAQAKATRVADGKEAITEKTTVAELRAIAAERGVDLKGLRLKKDIRDRIEGGSTSKPAPAKKAAPAKQTAKPNATEDAAVSVLMDKMEQKGILDEALKDTSAEDRKLMEEARARHKARMEGIQAKKAAPPAKKATPAKAAPASKPDISAIETRLSDFDNPPSREDAHKSLEGLSKSELVELGKKVSIPQPQSMTKEALRREIVEGTVGRRLDSISIRGFRGSKPGSMLQDLTPEEVADKEDLRAKGLVGIAAPAKKAAAPAVAKAAPERQRRAGPGGSSRPEGTGPDRPTFADLQAMGSREEVQERIKNLTIPELRAVAKEGDVPLPAKATKQHIRDQVTQWSVGRRLDTDAIARVAKEGAPARFKVLTRGGRRDDKGVPAADLKPRAGIPAAPSSAPAGAVGKMSAKPILENKWGMFGMGEVAFHDDGELGQALRRMGGERSLEVDGDALANVVGRLATDALRGKKTQKQLIDELKKVTAKLPEDSAARKELDRAVKNIDAPERDIDLPDGARPQLKTLMRELLAVPLARRQEDSLGRPVQREPEVDLLADIIKSHTAGEISDLRLTIQLEALSNRRHESMEGKFEIDQAIRRAINSLKEQRLADRKKRALEAEKALNPMKEHNSRSEQVKETAKKKTAETRALGGGTSTVRVLVKEDGSRVVHKNQNRHGDEEEARHLTDSETVSASVLTAAGVRAPGVVRTGPVDLDMEWFDGDALFDFPKELLDSDQGRLLGLGDTLTMNTDRGAGNLLADKSGARKPLSEASLQAIDNGFTFFFASPEAASVNPFSRHFTQEKNGVHSWAPENDMHPEDMALIRLRLESLRQQFDSLGRGGWFEAMMERMDILQAAAKGTRRRL